MSTSSLDPKKKVQSCGFGPPPVNFKAFLRAIPERNRFVNGPSSCPDGSGWTRTQSVRKCSDLRATERCLFDKLVGAVGFLGFLLLSYHHSVRKHEEISGWKRE